MANLDSLSGSGGYRQHKHLSDETKNKIRNSSYHKNLKGENNPNFGNGDHICGSQNPMFGKKHSKELIGKMRKKLAVRK